MNNNGFGNCGHVVEVHGDSVMLFNDDDDFYQTEFNSKAEVEAFILLLKVASNEAFNK